MAKTGRPRGRREGTNCGILPKIGVSVRIDAGVYGWLREQSLSRSAIAERGLTLLMLKAVVPKWERSPQAKPRISIRLSAGVFWWLKGQTVSKARLIEDAIVIIKHAKGDITEFRR